jgi:outer membrane lipoprotein-sorting protein
MKKLLPLIAMLLTLPSLSAQEIVTAEGFFKMMQEAYGAIDDYKAAITITQGKETQRGTIYFKNPQLLRIDYTEPANQVLVFNGQELNVYLPAYRAVLRQRVAETGSGPSLNTRLGLSIMRSRYTIKYLLETGSEPVPLDTGSSELVVKLELTSTSEGFKRLELAVNPSTKFIRRITGLSLSGDTVVFDFAKVETNIGLPPERFLFSPPATANVYDNFLFRTE